MLLAHTGRDVSELFASEGPGSQEHQQQQGSSSTRRQRGGGSSKPAHVHSAAARHLLRRFYVGRLAGAEPGSPAAPPRGGGGEPEWPIDENAPLLAQVGRLGAAYHPWLHRPSPRQPRFFRRDWMEALTKVEWWVVPVLWLPLVAAAFGSTVDWRGAGANSSRLAPAPAAALLCLGLVLWQLMEYSLHRWLFHQQPTSPRGIFLHFLLHG